MEEKKIKKSLIKDKTLKMIEGFLTYISYTYIGRWINSFYNDDTGHRETNNNVIIDDRIFETSNSAPKPLITIEKNQINTETYFLPFMGKHNLVRHWVIFNPSSEEKSIYCPNGTDSEPKGSECSYPAWVGHSRYVSTEMIALGCKNKIDQLMESLLRKNQKLPSLILIQTTGYYPLGIFTDVDRLSETATFSEGKGYDLSREITVEQAQELIKNIDYISIANIDY